MTAKQLRELRAAALGKADVLMKAAETDKRQLTDDEQTAFDGHVTEARSFDAKIKTAEDYELMTAEADKPDTRISGGETFTGDPDSRDTGGSSGGDVEQRVLPCFEADYRAENIALRMYLPARVQSRQTLRCFTGTPGNPDRFMEGQRDAWLFGHYILATLCPNKQRREDSTGYLKRMGIDIDAIARRAQSEGIDTGGGFLVPNQFENSIIRIVEQFGVARRECQIIPMGSDTATIPRQTGEATVTFTGENTTATETEVTFDNITLVARKLMALTRISSELQEDAVVQVADIIATSFALGFITKEDGCLFLGDGTATFGGIFGLSPKFQDGNHAGGKDETAGIDKFSEITDTHLLSLMAKTPFQPAFDEKWYISKAGSLLSMGRLLRAIGGNEVKDLAGAIPQFYMGAPIVIAQVMPQTDGAINEKAMMYFGNMRQACIFGDRRGITIDVDGSRYFDADQIAIRGKERFDIVVANIGDSSKAGPLVTRIGDSA